MPCRRAGQPRRRAVHLRRRRLGRLAWRYEGQHAAAGNAEPEHGHQPVQIAGAVVPEVGAEAEVEEDPEAERRRAAGTKKTAPAGGAGGGFDGIGSARRPARSPPTAALAAASARLERKLAGPGRAVSVGAQPGRDHAGTGHAQRHHPASAAFAGRGSVARKQHRAARSAEEVMTQIPYRPAAAAPWRPSAAGAGRREAGNEADPERKMRPVGCTRAAAMPKAIEDRQHLVGEMTMRGSQAVSRGGPPQQPGQEDVDRPCRDEHELDDGEVEAQGGGGMGRL